MTTCSKVGDSGRNRRSAPLIMGKNPITEYPIRLSATKFGMQLLTNSALDQILQKMNSLTQAFRRKLHRSGFYIFYRVLLLSKATLAFNPVTTFLPVLASSSSLATLATLPPWRATFQLSSKVSVLTACEISLVDASASIFKINSVLVHAVR